MKRVNDMHKQKGMTAIGMVILLFIIAFFALLLIKLAPIYIEGFKVSSVLESIVSDSALENETASGIKKIIDRRFNIDDVDSISSSDVRVTRDGGQLVLITEYEVRTSLFANVDLVVWFNKEIRE